MAQGETYPVLFRPMTPMVRFLEAKQSQLVKANFSILSLMVESAESSRDQAVFLSVFLPALYVKADID